MLNSKIIGLFVVLVGMGIMVGCGGGETAPAPTKAAPAPTATLVIGTHEATEAALADTVAALEASEVVAEVTSVLRVEGL